MLYNRRIDGVGYDQWKLSPPPYMQDTGLECEQCGISIDPKEEDVDQMAPLCSDCRCDEDEEASDESADESAEIYRLRRKIAKEQGLRLTDTCGRCGDDRHVCRCNT